MSEKLEPIVLHRAEELGQARAYTSEEAAALLRLALIVGLWTGALGLAVGMGVWLYDRYGWWTAFYIIALPVGVIVGGGLVLIKGAHEQLDGLRSWREATTYAPPQPQPAQPPSPWRPPVPVHRREGTTLLDMNERPALPDGRQSGLALNPPTVAAILREVITRHDGLWSRDRLMAIRVGGARVTRALYEDLTSKLARSGFLQERTSGGFKLPDDVADYDDLVRYFPSLAEPDGGKDGGTAGTGGPEGGKVPGKGVGTLAARRKRLWEECGHDVEAYLARKRGDDV